MTYEICVSRKREGDNPPRHVFATAPHSITNEEDARRIGQQLRRAYPKSMYQIEVTRIEHTGTCVVRDI